MLTQRELKRLTHLLNIASECQSYGGHEDPGRVATGFFFYGENAVELSHEACELINKLGGKIK